MYDAIVVGARCAGSPTAMLLARKGYRVLLLDKAGFPSDTLSTHYIHQPGVRLPQAMGPAGHRRRVELPAHPPEHPRRWPLRPHRRAAAADGVADAYAPRRRVLDRSWSTPRSRPEQSCGNISRSRSSSPMATASPASAATPPVERR